MKLKYRTGDDYKQSIVKNPADITPVVKPNVSQPSSDEIGAVLDGGAIDVTYTPDENEYSWPFVITEKDGEACIKATNSAQPSSFSIINAQLTLNAGDVVAFDYFASSELSCDIMYVIVNGHDIYSISGLSEDWKTCFAYVAEEAGEYTVSLSYLKDGDGDVGDDTVYVKNLRVVSEADINAPSYIFRYCATNPDDYGTYQDYVDIYYNETDGYYHVDSVDGPLLIANLMGYTLYNSEDSVFNAAQGKLTATDYDRLITYCGYASNGKINGSCTVNAELAELLKSFVGSPDPDDKEWLQLCNYYDSYGTDEELEDPNMQFMSGSDGVFEVSIESDNNATTVGNYGIPHFVQPEHIWVDGEDYDGKKFTVQITDGTTPYILGVKRAADESCIIKIRRVSDLPYDPSRLPWTEVTAKMQLTQFTLPKGTNLVDLDIANPNLTLTLGQDGYYYYNGKQVLIRLNTASSVLDPIALIAGIINENVGINFGGFIYDGETIVGRNRYNSMIGTYSAICDPTEGVCPLTEELAEAIKVHGEQAGWWNPEAMNYLFADKPAAKASAWLFACCVAE